jgi:short-chain 2-methylacyl-CoA dehydrogenase
MEPVTRCGPEEQRWREHVRSVAERHVAPLVREMDANARLDKELLDTLFRERLMSVRIPATYGGAGRGLFDVVVTIEELARVDPGVAVVVDVQNALVIDAILGHGTADQGRRFLPRLATGLLGAYAISEDHAGCDAFALSTVVEPEGDGFRLSGRKKWTTNAAEAGLFLVFAQTAGCDGLTAALVETCGGVSVGAPVDKLGIRASSTCPVDFDGVPVARRDVLGRPGDGAALAVQTLNIGKLGIAAQLVGLAQGALDAAIGYAQRREQFGQPIWSFQAVQFPLAAHAARLRAARALLYDTTRLVEVGASPAEVTEAAAMTKYVASDVAERIAAHAVEVFGGNGFSTEHPVEKFYRDVKVGKIYEGTSNMQFRTIASGLARAAAGRAENAPVRVGDAP